MSNRFRSLRRASLLLATVLFASLVFWIPRPASKGQELATPRDRKALREQVVALRAEIEVMEIEHENSAQGLRDRLKEQRQILMEMEVWNPPIRFERFTEQFVGDGFVEFWYHMSERGPTSDEELRAALLKSKSSPAKKQTLDKHRGDIIEVGGKALAKELDSLGSQRTQEEFSVARKRFADHLGEAIKGKSTESIRASIATCKREITRQAVELAGKLDLEALERQYREPR